MKLAHDGIQLSFDIAGAGPLQFLFVHAGLFAFLRRL